MFLIDKLEEYYVRMTGEDFLENFLGNNNRKSNSKDLESMLNEYLEGETPRVDEKFREMINKWYYDNIFYDKIMDFIEDSTLELGQRNWHIINKKYGYIDLNSLNKYFPNENRYQQGYFRQIYHQWFDDEALKISEKLMREF